MSKIEFCYVDGRGIHNKLYKEHERKKLNEDVMLVEKLLPEAPISLLGKHKVTGKPHRVTKGNFDWNDAELVVEVILVDNGQPVCDKDGTPILFTYITKKYVDISEQFTVQTARGQRTAIISSPCRRKMKTEAQAIATMLGYSRLVVLQDVIVKGD